MQEVTSSKTDAMQEVTSSKTDAMQDVTSSNTDTMQEVTSSNTDHGGSVKYEEVNMCLVGYPSQTSVKYWFYMSLHGHHYLMFEVVQMAPPTSIVYPWYSLYQVFSVPI